MRVPRKQISEQSTWLAAFDAIEELVPEATFGALVDQTVAAIRETCRGKRVGFGWSGGKDSIVLEELMYRAGFRQCVFGMTKGLEYPAFLAWVTDHMPHEVQVIANDWDASWLALHPEMLFPQEATVAARWFKGVQHSAQREYFVRARLDVIVLGRRRSDGNYVGPKGEVIYRAKDGTVRFSPMADWSHEAILAGLHYWGHRADMPPTYSWPRGFQVGTGAWPARQWTRSPFHGWCEVWSIDPTVVEEAARVFLDADVARSRILAGEWEEV